MINWKTIIILLSFLIFFSCNDDNNKQEPSLKKNDNGSLKNDSFSTSISNSVGKENFRLIEPEKLAEFLPMSIPKAEKYPSNSGFQIWNDKKISSASSEYIFKPGGIVIIINDYGAYNNIPQDDLQFIKKYSEQQFENVQKLILPDGIGYQKWDDVTDTGLFEALIFNRIIVRIEGIRLQEKYQNLSDFYYFINTKNILKEINKTN